MLLPALQRTRLFHPLWYKNDTQSFLCTQSILSGLLFIPSLRFCFLLPPPPLHWRTRLLQCPSNSRMPANLPFSFHSTTTCRGQGGSSIPFGLRMTPNIPFMINPWCSRSVAYCYHHHCREQSVSFTSFWCKSDGQISFGSPPLIHYSSITTTTTTTTNYTKPSPPPPSLPTYTGLLMKSHVPFYSILSTFLVLLTF